MSRLTIRNSNFRALFALGLAGAMLASARAQFDVGPNPLDSIATDMRVVSGQLSKFITHDPTQ